jgi:8-oxo-dGTP pyrophosphatase MutT (NUDIX family)
MIPVYARQPLPTKVTKSIFLAGPTPRKPKKGESEVESWRPSALQVLRSLGYDGHVYIPEPADGKWAENYDEQVEWEEAALNRADCILFWIPRDLERLPGFTTNDEWGLWKYSGKVVLGAPDTAPKVTYQRYYANKLQVPQATTLLKALEAAVDMVGEGAVRTGGETTVPLYIWQQESFQSWYQAQRGAGNELLDSRVLWLSIMPKARRIFCWVLKVSVYVASEDRVKSNEFVFGRPDISSVVLWHRAPTLRGTEVVLVREFRSPSRTSDGFIREMPGGSSKPGTDPKITAVEELNEEVLFDIDPDRLIPASSRQLYGTLSSVCAYAYSAEITAAELDYFHTLRGQAHGVEEDSERTYVEVTTVGDMLRDPMTDWATLGMVFTVLSEAMR